MAAHPRYADPEYQAAHDDTFSHPLVPEIEKILPPGVREDDFAAAVESFVGIVGKDNVITDLTEYVDPYDIPESGISRKVPSLALWYAPFPPGHS
jgi:hypothetical protein